MYNSGFLFLMIYLLPFIGCENNHLHNNNILQTSNDSSVVHDTARYTTITWRKDSVDLGCLKRGQKVVVSFEFENTGKDTLFIFKIAPECNCLSLIGKPGKYAPHEKAQISFLYNSEDDIDGYFSKSITLVTNTINQANHVLEIHGCNK